MNVRSSTTCLVRRRRGLTADGGARTASSASSGQLGNADQAARAPRQRAFSLIEILTVVALLSIIIVGLMATFYQTQRAWRQSMTQTDVLEAGRMATELISRDFTAVTPGNLLGLTNFEVLNETNSLLQTFPQTPAPGAEVRVNIRQRVTFLTQENKLWRGIGYRVIPNQIPELGVLSRFELDSASPSNAMWATLTLQHQPSTTNTAGSYVPIISGVVHFAVRAYDTNGVLLTGTRTNILSRPGLLPDAPDWIFQSNAVPAYVDLELGILEGRPAERARAIPNAALRAQYLANQLGHVHVFRQRIPIRDADPAAYR